MKPRRLTLASCLLAAMTLALLTACGGGDCDTGPECEGTKSTQPVDCKARPELCT